MLSVNFFTKGNLFVKSHYITLFNFWPKYAWCVYSVCLFHCVCVCVCVCEYTSALLTDSNLLSAVVFEKRVHDLLTADKPHPLIHQVDSQPHQLFQYS